MKKQCVILTIPFLIPFATHLPKIQATIKTRKKEKFNK